MSQIAVQQGGEIYFEDITETMTDETTPERDYLRNFFEEELESALGEPVATLISRKHYAVKYLRNRLKYIYEQMKN